MVCLVTASMSASSMVAPAGTLEMPAAAEGAATGVRHRCRMSGGSVCSSCRVCRMSTATRTPLMRRICSAKPSRSRARPRRADFLHRDGTNGYRTVTFKEKGLHQLAPELRLGHGPLVVELFRMAGGVRSRWATGAGGKREDRRAGVAVREGTRVGDEEEVNALGQFPVRHASGRRRWRPPS